MPTPGRVVFVVNWFLTTVLNLALGNQLTVGSFKPFKPFKPNNNKRVAALQTIEIAIEGKRRGAVVYPKFKPKV